MKTNAAKVAEVVELYNRWSDAVVRGLSRDEIVTARGRFYGDFGRLNVPEREMFQAWKKEEDERAIARRARGFAGR